MKKTNSLALLFQILRRAAWAPVLVFVFRAIAMALHIRAPLDPAIHFSGGLAIAYFFYRSIGICSFYLGNPGNPVRYLLTFTTACTAAVFWEIAEYASDTFFGTHIQFNVSETLLDLIYGTWGAFVSVILISGIHFLRTRNKHLK